MKNYGPTAREAGNTRQLGDNFEEKYSKLG